jgi:TRAP-type C4-dicarboxylate transport system permease small subunit
MVALIKRVDDTLAQIEKGAIVFGFGLLVASILLNILSRNLFHWPSHAVVEAGPRLVLWLALLGASLGLKHHRHIRLELVLRHCSDRMRRRADVIVNLFGAAVMAILMITAVFFVKNEITMFGRQGWLTIIFPFFFGVSVFRYLCGLLGVTSPTKTTVSLKTIR